MNYSVFRKDGWYATNGASLEEALAKAYVFYRGMGLEDEVSAWMQGHASSEGKRWQLLREESIAAGRLLEHCNGRFIPLGIPEQEKEKEAKSPLDQSRELVAIQGSSGDWDCDDYMVGMFKGMELALSVMEGREPQFRTLKPQQSAPEPVSTAKPTLPALTVLRDSGHQPYYMHGSALLHTKR